MQPVQSDGLAEMLSTWGFAIVLAAILAIAMIAVIASFAVHRAFHRDHQAHR